MRKLLLAAALAPLAAAPAMAQPYYPTPGQVAAGDAAAQAHGDAVYERNQARQAQAVANERAAMGDYAGAASAQRAARHMRHVARRYDNISRHDAAIANRPGY